MPGKPLLALAAVAALVALGIGVLSDGATAAAAWSGAGLGLACAFTAVLGPGWALRKGLASKGTLGVVLGGMLVRMVLVSGWTVIAFRVHNLAAIPFLAGFAAVYLPGQAIELALLRPATGRTAR